MLGERFGLLTVIEQVESNRFQKRQWLCVCACGNNNIVTTGHLKSGNTKSCGCNTNITHGYCYSPTYKSWQMMHQRCSNPKAPNYSYYGGRGVTVCKRWTLFENFLADMGERPDKTTLDRYPNKTGNYEPDNCRWATDNEQANNRNKRKVV